MLDISRINSQLWIGGGITSDADVRKIEALGITADVDLRLEPDLPIKDVLELPPTSDSLKHHPRILYLHAGAADDGKPKPVSWFRKVWDFAEPILKNDGVLLVHCAMGKERSPSVAVFLLEAYWHMSPSDAFALVREKRPQATARYRGDATKAIVQMGLAPLKEVMRMIDAARLAQSIGLNI